MMVSIALINLFM